MFLLFLGILLFTLFIISHQYTLQHIYKSVKQLPIKRFWFFSLPYLSSLFGAIFFGGLGKNVGIKWGIIYLGFLYTLASTAAIAETYQLVNILFQGILYWVTVGGALVLIPVYISEISGKYNREIFISLIYVSTNLAICLMNFVGVQRFHNLVPTVTMMVLCLVLIAQFYVCGQDIPIVNKKKNNLNSKERRISIIGHSTNLENFDTEEDGVEAEEAEIIEKQFMLCLNDNAKIKTAISMGGLVFLSSEIGTFNPTISITRAFYEYEENWKDKEIYYNAAKILGKYKILNKLACFTSKLFLLVNKHSLCSVYTVHL